MPSCLSAFWAVLLMHDKENYYALIGFMNWFWTRGGECFGYRLTDLLEQGVPLEDVQRLAGHANPRTTGPLRPA